MLYQDTNGKPFYKPSSTVIDKYGLTPVDEDAYSDLVEGLKSSAEPTDQELAADAQAYLDSTDYIENVYIREVVRNKSITESEYNIKYADIIELREGAIATISDYKDSL